MTAPAIIQNLVNRFRDSRELYRSGRYNEAQLRQEFLNPLFEALGWDMVNRSNFAPQYREVIHEDSLDDEGSLKAPDYAFRIGTTRKFFVEAKKPAVDIRYAIHPAYQLRRYAWNAHLPLSILTDFEELAVYDCRTRPDPKDSAATGRVMLFTFEEYVERWDEIAQIFSRDSVWNGSFDRYAEGSKGKRGTTEVDAEFLKEIEEWRILLARNIALRNFRTPAQPAETPPNLHRAERQLNYAVQTTIDRILFLRICEDRQIEPTDQLLQIAEGSDIYAKLLLLFQKADQKYNSGLFHFSKEKGQTSDPDTFTPSLQIDDKVLRQIIKSTYFPCPYMFNEIPVEILGQVYEQFLGSVIRLTPGGQAKVEEKPEVRKAGGVYYTPRYIVNYIVQNTLGRLLGNSGVETSSALPEGRVGAAGERDTSIDEDGLETLRSEPVRGVPTNASGVGVLRNTGTNPTLTPTQALDLRVVDPACGSGSFLLGAYQYLLDWHLNYYLSHDPQSHTRGKNPPLVATEGGEYRLTTETKKRILTASIYGVDIDSQAVEVTKLSLLLKLLEGETGQLSLGFERVLPDLGQNIRCGNSLIDWDYFKGQLFPDEEERLRVNPLDWQRAFPHVFASGGFDAVIGNPPYIDSEWLTKTNPGFREYCNLLFESAKGNWDIFCVFIEKAIDVTRQDGYVSMIVPNKLLSANYAQNIRKILFQKNFVTNWRDYSSAQVFPVAVYPIVFVLRKQKPEFDNAVLYQKIGKLATTKMDVQSTHLVSNRSLMESDFSNVTMFFSEGNPNILDEMLSKSSLLGSIAKVVGAATVSEAYEIQKIVTTSEYDPSSVYKFVNTGTIDRYEVLWGKKNTRYLNATYLMPVVNKKALDKYFPNRGKQAYSKKIIVGGMNKRLECCYDEGLTLAGKSTSLIYSSSVDLLYLIGILNSKLISYFYNTFFSGLKLQGGFFRIGPPQISSIPIKIIEETDPRFSQLTNLTRLIIKTKEDEVSTPYEVEKLSRYLAYLDSEIDKLVYSIYEIEEKFRFTIENSVE